MKLSRIVANLAGRVRREVRDGRPYLVAPVTMIVPGVLAGSSGPLFYSIDELRKNPGKTWNGVPITVGHPQSPDGIPLSADDPEILERQQVGVVLKARISNGKLVAEGWFDAEALRRVDKRILERLEIGQPIELSTGLFTDKEPVPHGATYFGRRYVGIARNLRGDHLAILPDSLGACSVSDGCGVLANSECGCEDCGCLDLSARAIRDLATLANDLRSAGNSSLAVAEEVSGDDALMVPPLINWSEPADDEAAGQAEDDDLLLPVTIRW